MARLEVQVPTVKALFSKHAHEGNRWLLVACKIEASIGWSELQAQDRQDATMLRYAHPDPDLSLKQLALVGGSDIPLGVDPLVCNPMWT